MIGNPKAVIRSRKFAKKGQKGVKEAKILKVLYLHGNRQTSMTFHEKLGAFYHAIIFLFSYAYPYFQSQKRSKSRRGSQNVESFVPSRISPDLNDFSRKIGRFPENGGQEMPDEAVGSPPSGT